MKRIVIAGGTGFIGGALQQHFKTKGYQIILLSRSKRDSVDQIHYVQWDGKNLGDWTKSLEGVEAVINLSGKNIKCRHTQENKQLILASRVDSTSIIGKAIETLDNPPKVWVNASGISFYADSIERQMTESNFEKGKGFISEVAQKWEEALFDSNSAPTRKVAIRIGVVMGDEGALEILRKQTKLGLGGTHASGKQIMPWIHIQDIVGLIDFIIQNNTIEGPVNACSPHPKSDKEFMKTLRQAMGVKIGLPAPAFAIKIGARILGTEAELILGSTNAYPEKLISNGYQFKFKELKPALEDLLSK